MITKYAALDFMIILCIVDPMLVFGYFVISIRSRRQSIDPWPTIICNIPTGIIPSCFEYDLIVFPFVTVLEYQSLINVFLTEIKAVITWSKKLQLVFCDLDPN